MRIEAECFILITRDKHSDVTVSVYASSLAAKRAAGEFAAAYPKDYVWLDARPAIYPASIIASMHTHDEGPSWTIERRWIDLGDKTPSVVFGLRATDEDGNVIASPSNVPPPEPKPGRVGGSLSKKLGQMPVDLKHSDHNVARVAAEAIIDDTDVDCAIVLTFKDHPDQGFAWRHAAVTHSDRVDDDYKSIYAKLNQGVAESVGHYLHVVGGQNVVQLDSTDRPEIEDAGS